MAQTDKKSEGNINPIAAVITGAVVGAGVAAVGALAWKDEKNREKVKDVWSILRDQAGGYIEKVQKEAEKRKLEGKKSLKEITEQDKKSGNTK